MIDDVRSATAVAPERMLVARFRDLPRPRLRLSRQGECRRSHTSWSERFEALGAGVALDDETPSGSTDPTSRTSSRRCRGSRPRCSRTTCCSTAACSPGATAVGPAATSTRSPCRAPGSGTLSRASRSPRSPRTSVSVPRWARSRGPSASASPTSSPTKSFTASWPSTASTTSQSAARSTRR